MKNTRKAIITGVGGQDGSYLAELLLEKGYKVWGIHRHHSSIDATLPRLNTVIDNENFILESIDITDMSAMARLFQQVIPDEIYNFAAQSHVKISFEQPILTIQNDLIGVQTILECARMHCKSAKIYQAGSSEMYGTEHEGNNTRSETTTMRPVSPYACGKLYAYNLCQVYRNSYNMFVVNGILFNHESPRRGIDFVTSKIVEGAIKIYRGQQTTLALGNLEAGRDWGHAKDFVRAIWMMLQHDTSDEWVCATGETHTVREVCEIVFSKLGLNYSDYVIIDPKYYRPTEGNTLRGDPSKLSNKLGWSPEYTFQTMIEEMVEKRLKNEI
jgi:GDPmannose 4,6-dehydratase